MVKKLERPIAFLSAFAMFMTILMYFPVGTFSSIDWEIKAKANAIERSVPEGDGSKKNPYQIGTAEELYWFADLINITDEFDIFNDVETEVNAVLTADITVNSGLLSTLEYDQYGNVTSDYNLETWTPIGTFDNEYTGTFDGNNHVISGLYVNDENNMYVGLFGYSSYYSTIKNVGIEDSYFKGNDSVGGVCGRNDGIITNCYNKSQVSGTNKIGGVCGNNGNTITNCYNVGEVSGITNVGGVYGSNSSTIQNCYYLEDKENNLGGRTKEQFASGEIAYLLQSGQDEDENWNIPEIWGQNITDKNADPYPVLGGEMVYATTGCVTYNNDGITSKKQHNYSSDGFCKDCGDYESVSQIVDDEKYKGYYALSNEAHLYWFANKVNSGATDIDAVLTSDIVVNSNLLENLNDDGTVKYDASIWTPINNYTGDFDGQNYSISGLYFNDADTDNVGLFGTNYGAIKNVVIKDSYLQGYTRIGSVCGENIGGKITNCYNMGEVRGHNYVGGLCGINRDDYGDKAAAIAEIANCHNAGEVKCKVDNSIISCSGGLCGLNSSNVTNCYNTGEISGSGNVGGLCGINQGTITNCYNTALVTAKGESAYAGEWCGLNWDGTIKNCYYLADEKNSDGGRTKEQFASGEICYLLNNLKSDGDVAWRQSLAEKNADSFPVLNGNKVYRNEICTGCSEESKGKVTYVYSNKSEKTVYASHKYVNGFCTMCGEFEAAKQIDDVKSEYYGYYEISNAGKLYWFAGLVNGILNGVDKNASAKAVLTADITVNSDLLLALQYDQDGNITNGQKFKSWIPIGNKECIYTGTFDGNNHKISGLYLNDADADYVGLFGFVKENGSISNVFIEDSYLNGNCYIGSICGVNSGGTITNCHNTGKVDGKNCIGGVCGVNSSGTITDCYNTGEIKGTESVGGVCGSSANDTITKCYSTGEVRGTTYVGGMCGNSEYGKFTICYNTGEVRGTNYVGGMCGKSDNDEITKCYNTGKVGGAKYVGGMCGHNALGKIINCYNTSKVVGTEDYVGGMCGMNDGTITNCYNTGEANGIGDYIGIVCGYNSDNEIVEIKNCYYLADKSTSDGGRTKEQFASGEVCYLLNGSTSEETLVWGQTLEGENTDPFPVLNGEKVYLTTGCVAYTNTEYDGEKPHNYENGECIDCGIKDPMLKNKNYPKKAGYTGEAILEPTKENFTYNGNGELTFTWFNEGMKLKNLPTNIGEYTLMVEISKTDEYDADFIILVVEIVKGTPEYTVPTGLTATYGNTLADVELPKGFTWQEDKKTSVGNVGTNTFKVTFTPADTDNYNVIKDIEVTIEVSEAEITTTTESTTITTVPETTTTTEVTTTTVPETTTTTEVTTTTVPETTTTTKATTTTVPETTTTTEVTTTTVPETTATTKATTTTIPETTTTTEATTTTIPETTTTKATTTTVPETTTTTKATTTTIPEITTTTKATTTTVPETTAKTKATTTTVPETTTTTKATTTTVPEITMTTKATTTTAPETTTTKATTTTAPETTTTKATTTTAPETTTKATTTTAPETTTTTKATTTTAPETTTTTKATTTTAPETTTTTSATTTTTVPETTTTKATTTTVPETTTTKATTTTAPETTTTTKATTTTAPETTTTTEVTTTTAPETTTTKVATTTATEVTTITTTETTSETIVTDTIKSDGLTYKVDTENKTASLIGCDESVENVVIPSEIQGNKVVKIASTAFKNNAAMKSISIPETVEEVDEVVFDDLEEIDVYVVYGSKIQQFLDGNEIKYSLAKNEKYLLGDIDSDGKITSADALIILQNVVELKEFTAVEKLVADVDFDGEITSADALMVLQYVVELKGDFNGAISVNVTVSEDSSSVISKEYYDKSNNIVDIKAE